MTRFHTRGIPLFLLITGCAHTHAPGTAPHEMSAAQHETEAQADDALAESHASRYDPSAREAVLRCSPDEAEAIRQSMPQACWTSMINPTAEHKRLAEHHRRLASRHRAASQALREAEARECEGITEDDRVISPLEHYEDIDSVRPLRDGSGVEIGFRAVPGLNAPWLQRLVSCHQARNAAIGYEQASADMPSCPLALLGVKATVSAVDDGFVLTVRSDDADITKRILRRADLVLQQTQAPETRAGHAD